MSGIDVAVIIVTWNSSALLGAVLNYLRQQTLEPNRVLVVDNGSSDAETTANVVATFSDVELVSLPNNIGFAAANNIGIAKCVGVDLIALLNPDAFPQPDWLARLVSAAQKNSNFSSFASRLLNHANHDIIDGAGDSMSIFGKPRRRGHGIQAKGVFKQAEQVFSPSAAAAIYRRKALVDVGGFDEDYFCYLEDVDLGFRLRLAGYSAMYVPDAIVYHIGSATTGGQHSDFSVYHGHRNLVWTFVKNMPGILFWLLLPLHILLNVVTIFWFIVRGQSKVILRSKWDALMGVPRMWTKRKQIQRNRKVAITDIWRVLEKSLIRDR